MVQFVVHATLLCACACHRIVCVRQPTWTVSPFAPSFKFNPRPANLSLPQIFAATSARMVPDPSKAFAICPHGLPEERQVQLEKTCEDFRVPPASQRVTLYWLQVRNVCVGGAVLAAVTDWQGWQGANRSCRRTKSLYG